MPEPIEERRRMPRRTVRGLVQLLVPVTTTVQLLDISEAGVLLSCRELLPVGQRGRLQMLLDGEPFAAELVICRSERRSTREGLQSAFGAAFVGLSGEGRTKIQRFLRGGSGES